jgi:hypothetical protein
MIGETLHSPRRFPWGTIVWLTVAAGCMAIAVATGDYHMAVIGVLPATLAVVLFLRRPPEFHAEIMRTEIFIHSANESIPFANIERLWSPSSNQLNGLLIVYHRGGSFEIPPNSARTTQSLREFLESVMPPRTRPVVHGAIAGYLDSQTATFGAERVWAYAAEDRPKRKDKRLFLSIYMALAITAVAWIVAGSISKESGWYGAAVFMGIIALIVLLVQTMTHGIDRRIKNWRESSLVVTPFGLALVQGDLKGELRWRELVDVQYKGGSSAASRKIQLKVEGASIDIMDIYDTPLSEIHERIASFWKAQ